MPPRQATLDQFVKRAPAAASSASSKSTSRAKGSRSRKKPDAHDSDSEDEFVPDEHDEDEHEQLSEVEEEESEVASSAAYSEEDEKPARKGAKGKGKDKGKGKAVASDPHPAGGRKKKESYRCLPLNCELKIEPRDGQKYPGLAPLHSLPTIFGDIVDRIVPHVSKLLGTRRARKLRVATMCSGTESPLLALQMFSRAIKERGLGRLEIDHVFSCEIEPYKQAYIERNFKPPVLFRDIKELGADEA